MKRISTLSIICLGLGLHAGTAEAGPCTSQIEQLEISLRQAGGLVAAAPSGPESIGAKLHHQPTPDSVARARQAAQSRVDDILAQAKQLDAKGEADECRRAVANAKLLLTAR